MRQTQIASKVVSIVIEGRSFLSNIVFNFLRLWISLQSISCGLGELRIDR